MAIKIGKKIVFVMISMGYKFGELQRFYVKDLYKKKHLKCLHRPMKRTIKRTIKRRNRTV